jgi:hypothetical protein
MKTELSIFAALLLAPLAVLHAEESLVYKKAGDRELKLFIEKPSAWKPTDQRPAQFLKQSGFAFKQKDGAS